MAVLIFEGDSTELKRHEIKFVLPVGFAPKA